MVAQIGDVPLTISELEFRKGLYASVNPAKGTNDIFNELVENKIFINEAVQKFQHTNAELMNFCLYIRKNTNRTHGVPRWC